MHKYYKNINIYIYKYLFNFIFIFIFSFWIALNKGDNENIGILDNTNYFFNDDDEEDESFNEVEIPESEEENPIENALKDAIIDGDMGNYGEQLVAKPKKIKSLAINYARSDKRVDVKKLKDNIWKELAGTDNDETSTMNEKNISQSVDSMDQDVIIMIIIMFFYILK